MAKSKNGCLKILACAGAGSDPSAGSDADANDNPDENKAISDKSRWSFRRRSTRHRVLKNSDISEPETLSSSKAKSDITPSNNVYTSTYTYDSEKPLHQEKPDDKILHEEKTEKKPLHQEKSDEELMDKPIEKPVDEQMEEPVDQITVKSIEQLAEKETLTGEPAEKISDVPSEETAEKTTETTSEDPTERVIENQIEETSEQTVDELIEKPSKSISVSSTELKEEETTSLIKGSSAECEEYHLEPAAALQSGSTTCIERQELLNQKDLVKLQAVIRGHLVRRQASESLQCLIAIVKIQGLIRVRQAQKSSGKFQENAVHSSCEKLLPNGFALKLMNSMLATKSIHIKCDPSESDATWKWMERWTSLIPPVTGEHLPEYRENNEMMGEDVKEDSQHDDEIVPLDSDISFPKLVPDDVKEAIGTSDSSALEAAACIPDESSEVEVTRDPESELIENVVDAEKMTEQKTVDVVYESSESSDQQNTQTDALREPSPPPEKHESSIEDINDTCNSEYTMEMEDKRFAARKSCNPAFAAAQLKFEELSINSAVSRSSSSSYLDGASKSKVHTPRSQEDYSSSKQDNDMSIPESLVGHDAKMIIAASECGTEISISSTLDSPDRSEGDGGEIVLEIGALENRNYVPDKADKDSDIVDSEVKNAPEIEAQPQKEVQQNGHVADYEIATDPEFVLKPRGELEKSDLHDHMGKSLESYATPEGTPMSRTTVAESHGTPSSETSINTKKSKSKKARSHASKRSLASPSSDSVGRSSTDNLSKDYYRHPKRENSSKVAKSDHVDQEPRISNSNPLPSYMQFTESARAKASASVSPKMSPDVQDNPRKRHSLPMTNGKQDSSPRMQRSSSQAQQNVKSNGAVPHNSSDKRWHI